MKGHSFLLLVLFSSFLLFGCAQNTTESRLQQFITTHVAQVEPLTTHANLTYWKASTTGNKQDYDELRELQIDIRRIYSNSQEYALIEKFRNSGQIEDARLKRQLDILHCAYLRNQIEPDLLKKIIELDTKIQQEYSHFRGILEGKEITNSDIYMILTTETDPRIRELAWKASKQVGEAVIDDFLQLVKCRNEAAKQLGFDSFHTLSIITSEQRVEELDRIFAELDQLTYKPYVRLKSELDRILADGFGIPPEDLMPWHYHDPFFQRTPLVYEYDLDLYYENQDVKELTRKFYAGVGLPVDDILARSDLYDRKGKYPHAYSHDVDRRGDVRILCNLQNTERWMETILHELGHAVYSKYHDPNEPWLLREPAHSFTTEAVAMLFGRLSRNPAWMQKMLGLTSEQRAEIEQVSRKYLQFQQVLFARWAMVMYHFEKQLYADPDQDMNTLWWDLVEKYQLIKRPPGPPDAGWLSKLHFTSAPCYYHNYMLGEMLASQLHNYIVHQLLRLESDKNVSYVGRKEIGDYLRKNVLGPGALYHWNDMIARATGEPLTARYFVRQFIE
ncbi:MAG: M2 family metallopeptidase [Sedimentisphaerales bacterium]|nr:M2 family metallopeptidase [Sedimentisphaerales bacterium]